MPLPTTGLTLHLDAKDTDHLFTTYVSSGVHTGTPVDGSDVQVWDDEGDGISDVCAPYVSDPVAAPTYRVATPLMLHPCLDFDGSNDAFLVTDQTGTVLRPMSDLISVSAATIIIAFWAESITNTSVDPFSNHGLVANNGGYCGVVLRDVSGVKKLRAYNYDGSYDSLEVDIAEGRTYIGIFQHASGNLKMTVIDDTGNESSASDVASGDTASLTNPLGVGKGYGAYLNGRIGELAVWNVALIGTNLTDAKDYFKAAWIGGGGGFDPKRASSIMGV